ncbi:MAG: nucleotidyl transferase AbiEii/AbiGii toxin family protein, partial [Anaerovoracaceae bacterium]
GVGDIIVPESEKREIPIQLEGFAKPVVSTYSIETTIAEKLDAILDLMEFSSRMKDYYDIYYIANTFDFNGETLAKALRTTIENRGHNFTIEQFNRVVTFADDINMQKKWKLFIRKIDVKTDEYSVVIDTIKTFLAKPFASAVENTEFNKKWSASKCRWL